MEKYLLQQVKRMKIYLAVITLLFIVTIVYGYTQKSTADDRHPHFQEIDVERINVVEKDGKLKMVISNHEKQSPGIIDGKTLAARDRDPGIIFFNTDGDECGGLTYSGDAKDAGMVLCVDQYKQDQLMQLQYSQENGTRSYGLKLWDRPDTTTLANLITSFDSLKKLNDTAAYNQGLQSMKARGLLGIERLFVGKDKDGEVGIFIKDNKGIPRIKLYVDKYGKGKVETMNDN